MLTIAGASFPFPHHGLAHGMCALAWGSVGTRPRLGMDRGQVRREDHLC